MNGAVYWFIECFKADTVGRSHRQINRCVSVLFHSIKDYIFLAVLFVEGIAQGTQRKEVIVAVFVKRFKSFMTEVPILLKLVHSFGEQINGLVSI